MKKYIDQNSQEIIKNCIDLDKPVLLVGETGTGKTTTLNLFAEEHGKTLHRISVNGATSTEEILGKFIPKGKNIVWNDGILISAMKKGDWIVFDELNSAVPDILFCLHSLLDDDKKVTLVEKDNEVIKPHKDFRFFATMNPSEEYTGTKEMNRAFISRFSAVLNVEVLPQQEEYELLLSKGISESTSKKVLGLATELRELKKQGEILGFCSTRDVIQCGLLIEQGLDFGLAVQTSIVNKFDKVDQERLEEGGVVKSVRPISLEYEKITKLEKRIEELSRGYTKLENEAKELQDVAKNQEEMIKKAKAESLKYKNESKNSEKVKKLEALLLALAKERDELLQQLSDKEQE